MKKIHHFKIMAWVWMIINAKAEESLNKSCIAPGLEKAGVFLWNSSDDSRQYDKFGQVHHRFDILLSDSVETNRPLGDLNQEQYLEELKRYERPHYHLTDEIRLIHDGSCYYDIICSDGSWVRLELVKGDGIFIPAGTVHRVFLTITGGTRYIKASGYYRSSGQDDAYIPRFEE